MTRYGIARIAGGLGPVFATEWRMTSRRWQTYAMRSATVLILLVGMGFVWVTSAGEYDWVGENAIRRQVEVARAFFGATAIILLGLVGLAAPAAAAGSICQDKARGNLTLLFASDLSNAEIVLGKLGARLVPVMGLILCAAPVLSIATLFGGIDPVGVVGTLLVVLGCAIFGCSLAMTLSVWGRKTHEVLMATYLFGLLYLVVAPILAFGVGGGRARSWWPSWFPTFAELLEINPIILVLSALSGSPPGMRPVTLATHARFLGLGLAVSAALAGLAIWQVRRVVLRQIGQVPRTSRWTTRGLAWLRDRYRRIVPGPSLDRNPVLWRECHRKRPSRWGLVLWGVYAALCGAGSLEAIRLMIDGQRWGRNLGVAVNALQVAGGLLMLSVSAATSLAEERQQSSLDVLLTTPLSTRSIVWGKWCGAFLTVPKLLVLPLLVTFAMALHTGYLWGVGVMAALILSYGAAITSLGLAMATWMPKLGHAVGTTVGLYTMMCIGWIPVSFILFGEGPRDEGIGVAAGSPIMGVGFYSALLSGVEPNLLLVSQTAWMIGWTLFYAGIALTLLLTTEATFNRCLGRIDEPPREEDRDLVGQGKGSNSPINTR